MSRENQTDSSVKRFGAKLLRLGLRLAGTAAVAALAVGAVTVIGQRIEANAANQATLSDIPPVTVAVAPVDPRDSYVVPQRFIARIEPARETSLGFEAGGTLSDILVDEGDTVAQGDVLARLDTRLLEAQLDQQIATRTAIEAQLELARATSRRQGELADRNFASLQRADEARFGVDELVARRAAVDAAIAELKVQLDKSELRAPFAGTIGARFYDDGARVGGATPIVELLETDRPLLRVGLTPDMAARLQPGDPLSVRINGEDKTARMVSRRDDIDPVTRTQPVLFALPEGQSEGLVFGDVVSVDLPREIAAPGMWVPLSALSEGLRGLWTIYVVDETENGPVTERESVELIYADETRAYVRGALAGHDWIVTGGPHRLTTGQTVALQPIAAKG
ncbi:MAG: efflux RND transporter periplasmic adaptor subunit [Pseudomonadota bacterium]